MVLPNEVTSLKTTIGSLTKLVESMYALSSVFPASREKDPQKPVPLQSEWDLKTQEGPVVLS